jgi:hypothetical protein
MSMKGRGFGNQLEARERLRNSSRTKQLARRTHRTRRIWVSEEILDAHPAVDRASVQGHEEDLVALGPREDRAVEARPALPPRDVEGES